MPGSRGQGFDLYAQRARGGSLWSAAGWLTARLRPTLPWAIPSKGRGGSAFLPFLLPSLIFLGIFLLYPTFYNFYLSFFRLEQGSGNLVFVGLANFRAAMTDPIFRQAIRNTLLWAIVGVSSEILMGFTLAWLLASLLAYRLPGARWFQVLWFMPVMLSEAIVAIMWSLIYEPRVGLANKTLELVGLGSWKPIWLGDPRLALYALIAVSTWMWTGFNMVLFLAGITSIPRDLLDAASVDGASSWQQIRYLILPLLRNLTVTLVVLSFTGKLKMFGLPWVATPRGGPLGATEVVSTYMVRRAFFYETFDQGYPAALATIWFFVIMLIAAILTIGLRRRERLELG